MKRVIFIGDESHHEFREPLAWLREYCELTICETIDATLQVPPISPEHADAIILGQTQPAQVQRSDVERLRIRASQARLIRLLGGWCEGELRSSHDALGVEAFYWHQFFGRVADELAPNKRSTTASGLVVIRTVSRDSYEAISGVCDALGYSTAWVQPEQPPFATSAIAGIWDCRNAISADCKLLTDFVERLTTAPVIALLGFPRNEDWESAFSCGASAVVSKPFSNDGLANTLARVTASHLGSGKRTDVA